MSITSEDLFQRERAIGEIATSQHLFALGIGAVGSGIWGNIMGKGGGNFPSGMKWPWS